MKSQIVDEKGVEGTLIAFADESKENYKSGLRSKLHKALSLLIIFHAARLKTSTCVYNHRAPLKS